MPSSHYRGVSWHSGGKWCVSAWDGTRQRYYGLFDDEEEAARAYDAAAKDLYEGPVLNFLPDGSLNPERRKAVKQYSFLHKDSEEEESESESDSSSSGEDEGGEGEEPGGAGAKKSCGYRGVFWDKVQGKWRARIRLEGKSKYLGRFASATEAAKVVDATAKRYYENYRPVLNFFPDGSLNPDRKTLSWRGVLRRRGGGGAAGGGKELGKEKEKKKGKEKKERRREREQQHKHKHERRRSRSPSPSASPPAAAAAAAARSSTGGSGSTSGSKRKRKRERIVGLDVAGILAILDSDYEAEVEEEEEEERRREGGSSTRSSSGGGGEGGDEAVAALQAYASRRFVALGDGEDGGSSGRALALLFHGKGVAASFLEGVAAMGLDLGEAGDPGDAKKAGLVESFVAML